MPVPLELDPDSARTVSVETLTPYDQFHYFGAEAVEAAIPATGVTEGSRVLRTFPDGVGEFDIVLSEDATPVTPDAGVDPSVARAQRDELQVVGQHVAALDAGHADHSRTQPADEWCVAYRDSAAAVIKRQ